MRRRHGGQRSGIGRQRRARPTGQQRAAETGGDSQLGQRSAEEDSEKIAAALADSDMVFITAGLGGGTGSGAAPIVAANARKHGALTIAVVTKPFGFEGTQRKRIADEAAAALESRG